MTSGAFRFVARARLLEVHDGDTVRLGIDRGLDGTTTPTWIRLGGPVAASPLNVYAPELADVGGIDCGRFTDAWLDEHGEHSPRAGWPFVIETWKTRGDEPKKTLGRYLGEVTCAASGESLNVAVAAYVKAKGYGGGTGSSQTQNGPAPAPPTGQVPGR